MAKQRLSKGKMLRLTRPLPPDSQTRNYQRELRLMVAVMKDIVNRKLVPQLQRIVQGAIDDHRPTPIKTDGYAADVHELVKDVRFQFEQTYTEAEIRELAHRQGLSVAQFNAKQMNKQFQRVVEIDLFGFEPWIGTALEDFTIANSNLIKSIPEKYFTEIENLTLQGVNQGVRWESIAEQIQERYDVSESKANLLARDQIGKLNGQFTELRQTEVGIDKYRWRGVGDSRERQTHKANNDRVFKWSNPPRETGHPGQDYQCRCWAEPVINLENDDE